MRLDYTYVFQILNFVILFLLLRRYLFGPVKAYLDRREQHIRTLIASAEEDRKAASKLKDDLEREISRARDEARDIVARSRRDADAFRAEARELAAKDASLILARAREELAREKEKAIRDIRKEAVDLSLIAASRVLRESIDGETSRRIASQAIQEIVGAKVGGNVS
ncbi:MAG: F0F1 ATP synthase subunit B [Bacillota bacterium]